MGQIYNVTLSFVEHTLFLTLRVCGNVPEIKRTQSFLHKSYVDFTRDQYYEGLGTRSNFPSEPNVNNRRKDFNSDTARSSSSA